MCSGVFYTYSVGDLKHHEQVHAAENAAHEQRLWLALEEPPAEWRLDCDNHWIAMTTGLRWPLHDQRIIRGTTSSDSRLDVTYAMVTVGELTLNNGNNHNSCHGYVVKSTSWQMHAQQLYGIGGGWGGGGRGGVTLPNNVRAAEMTLSSLYLIIYTWPVLRTVC